MGESTNDRVRKHRQSLRDQGLRPVQFWIPDTRAPGFAAEALRQTQEINRADQASDDMDFVEAISEDWGE